MSNKSKRKCVGCEQPIGTPHTTECVNRERVERGNSPPVTYSDTVRR